MKTLIALALISISSLSFAQTDIIEMRSRGASLESYEHNVSASSSYHVPSNFGAAPTMLVRSAVLDSVKSISDSITVMYTSNYCGRLPRTRDLMEQERNRQNGQGPEKIYQAKGIGELWEPGADTIVHHPLFRNVHSLDSVKEVIDKDYYFNLPSDSITFIGFDNSQGSVKKDSKQRIKYKHTPRKNSFGWELLFMIITPIAFLFTMSRIVSPRTTDS
ncbi:MAG: hypothetical protein P8P74_06125 [Crocinitomicaceae bacterium]|nr:hypothetical protein [Crocinitomicaceae bacterium]